MGIRSAYLGRPVFAIVDNGVDLDHPDLQGACFRCRTVSIARWDRRKNSCEGDGGPGPTYARHRTLNAHGTAVTGIAAAERDNGEGITGVAPDAYWSSHRVLLTIDPSDPVTSARNLDIGEAMCLAIDPPGPFIVTEPDHNPGKKDIYINAWGPVDATEWRTTAVRSAQFNTATRFLAGYNFGRFGVGEYLRLGRRQWRAVRRPRRLRPIRQQPVLDRRRRDRRQGTPVAVFRGRRSVFIAAPSSIVFRYGRPRSANPDDRYRR